MHRLIRAGVATAALAAASTPLIGADNAETERAYALAARGFTNCLVEAASPADAAPGRSDLAKVCLLQETALRDSGVRLRLSRGQAEQQAANETEADIIAGRRMVLADHARRYALAR